MRKRFLKFNENRNHYAAQGFVEALIAILVTGIAAVALMTVAANTISTVVRNELEDQLTAEAVKGAKLMSYLVDEHNAGVDHTSFLPITTAEEGDCFAIDGTLQAPFISPKATPVCGYQTSPTAGINPSLCLNTSVNIVIDEESFKVDADKDDLFRLMCVHPDSTTGPGSVLVTKFITGLMSCRNINAVVTTGTISESIAAESGILSRDDCRIYQHTAIFTVN